jgi:hypothetical protein
VEEASLQAEIAPQRLALAGDKRAMFSRSPATTPYSASMFRLDG